MHTKTQKRWLGIGLLTLLAGCGFNEPPPSAPEPDPDPMQPPPDPDPTAAIFDTNEDVPEFWIELSEAAVDALVAEPKTYVAGTFIYEGARYERVGIRLKGQSSFLPLWRKGSLKVKFDKFVDGGEFLGLEELTLNNMSSDPTMLRERLAYRVYREASVPASRCGHARVYVNGTYYGLFANVETVDRRLIRRWFEDASGPLFEGWDVDFRSDQVDAFELEARPDDRTALRGAAEALELEPPETAIQAASAYIDWSSFRRYWAVTAVVGQFDAYPYHLDDYHIYVDPKGQKLHFLPWGTDESFDAKGFSINGLLARKCLGSMACADSVVREAMDVMTVMEQLDIETMIDDVAIGIEPFMSRDLRRPYSQEQTDSARDLMHSFVADRRTTLEAQILGQPIDTSGGAP